MGLGADFIRAPRRGRLLIVSTSGVLERAAGLLLSVSLPDRVWITGIGGRLPLRSRPSRHPRTLAFILRARAKTAPAAFLLRIDCYSLQKRTCRTTVSLRQLIVQKNQRFAAHWQRIAPHFLQQLQPSCSVPRLRTRVPQRRRITANNPTKLSHDDARRPPHVQRDEAAHAFCD